MLELPLAVPWLPNKPATPLPHRPLQDEAAALDVALGAAAAAYEAARAELGDVYRQWERDREELVDSIRRVVVGRWGGAIHKVSVLATTAGRQNCRPRPP